MNYKCNECGHEARKFGLCPKCPKGLMIRKEGVRIITKHHPKMSVIGSMGGRRMG